MRFFRILPDPLPYEIFLFSFSSLFLILWFYPSVFFFITYCYISFLLLSILKTFLYLKYVILFIVL